MEIERKWLLNSLPKNLTFWDYCATIEQAYLTIEKFSDVITKEVRVRKKTTANGETDYKLAYKIGSGLIREEIETPIAKDFWKECTKHIIPIRKKYYTETCKCPHYKDDDLIQTFTVEFSEVDDGEFYYAEVEFDSIEDANHFNFPYPSLVIREATDDDSVRMANYWIKTAYRRMG